MNAKKSVISTAICLATTLSLITPIAQAGQTGDLRLGYRVISSYGDGSGKSIWARLRIENIGSEPIFHVMATKVSSENMTVEANTLFLGDIRPGGKAYSDFDFRIAYQSDQGQSVPVMSTLWRIEYQTKGGDAIVVVISDN